MTTRIITGIIITILILGIVLLAPPLVIQAFLGLAILGAVWEFLGLGGLSTTDKVVGTAAAAGLMTGTILGLPTMYLLIPLALLLLLYLLFTHPPMERALHRGWGLLGGLLYPGLLGAGILLLPPMKDGRYLVLLAAGIAFIGDTTAYFGGRFTGKHKLWPAVSPKKTWEGSFWGLVGSVLAALGVQWIFNPGFSLTLLALFGFFGGILGQLGDLVESVFKRSAGVKDSGHVLPGHGGLYDRVDAFLFVGAFIYLVSPLLAG